MRIREIFFTTVFVIVFLAGGFVYAQSSSFDLGFKAGLGISNVNIKTDRDLRYKLGAHAAFFCQFKITN